MKFVYSLIRSSAGLLDTFLVNILLFPDVTTAAPNVDLETRLKETQDSVANLQQLYQDLFNQVIHVIDCRSGLSMHTIFATNYSVYLLCIWDLDLKKISSHFRKLFSDLISDRQIQP